MCTKMASNPIILFSIQNCNFMLFAINRQPLFVVISNIYFFLMHKEQCVLNNLKIPCTFFIISPEAEIILRESVSKN